MITRTQKVKVRRNQTEHDHQAAFFSWVRLNEKKYDELKMFFAIPNGGARDHGTAVALYLEGVRPGVLDTFLPLARHGKVGLWIEFKSATGTLSLHQEEFKTWLEAEGHAVYVVRDWVEAAAITAAYLELEGVQLPRAVPSSLRR